jgi:hypothetical protein
MSQGIVIGPMISAFGFRSWFWGCRPSTLVAVPGGFWVAISAATATGGITGVVGAVSAVKGGTKGNKTVNRIQSASDEELVAMAGAVVYHRDDLESIICKRPLVATNPDFIVTTKGGTRMKYGLAHALTFDAVVEVLRECYGDLVQRP